MSSSEPAARATDLIHSLSLRRVVSLLKTVLVVRLLNAVLYVTRLDRSYPRFPCTFIDQFITRREQHIINILLTIVPEELYQPTNANVPVGTTAGRLCILSNASSDLRGTTGGSASTNMTLPLMPVPTRVSPMVHLTNCISHRSVDVEIANAMNRAGSELDDTSSRILGHQPLVSDSVYSSVIRRSLSISDPSSIPAGQNMFPGTLPGVRLSGMLSERLRFSIMNRPLSMDTMTAVPDPIPADMERLQRMRSADSYPGKFPISEGLEFSSLATAVPRANQAGSETAAERAVVRPFTDV
ncbi:hypothetical protein BO71DRAFT_340852 [Aspergillus ellipticus CBS 707.79]|uniref:Uncharacterized protein n=1 Tax=Aspergillus ellipticus CBS 707.79 TaxID=1448320 RepID=A0A319CSQ8_9EURO|nr:hypothetical protein BO71DRAFT_340852 [Aspergillus ellipticus CBS 707.79]